MLDMEDIVLFSPFESLRVQEISITPEHDALNLPRKL